MKGGRRILKHRIPHFMLSDCFLIENLNPNSYFGELGLTFKGSSSLNELAAKLILDNSGMEEVEDLKYESLFHPASQDIKLSVVWKNAKEEKPRKKILSMASYEKEDLIKTIHESCKSQFGLSPEEILDQKRKLNEQEALNAIHVH